MTRSTIPGWTETVKTDPASGDRLRILAREGDTWWMDIAAAFRSGALSDVQEIQSSPWTVVVKAPLPDGGPDCYFKRFRFRDWRDRFKHLVRSSRARRALLGGELATARGFRAPRALCAIEVRRAGLLRESVLVTEAVPNAPDVRAWLNEPELGVAADSDEKREFVQALGREVGTWHKAGLHHGDARLGNILCRREGESFSFIWLDNERTSIHDPLPLSLRVHNLMQVNMDHYGATLTDRMRFWKAYVEAAGIPPAEQKNIAREVIALTRKRWKKRGLL